MLVKNLKFEQNFQHNPQFLILPNFMFHITKGGQKSQIWAKFRMWL